VIFLKMLKIKHKTKIFLQYRHGLTKLKIDYARPLLVRLQSDGIDRVIIQAGSPDQIATQSSSASKWLNII